MRHIAALFLMAAAVLLACLAWPQVWAVVWLRNTADRLRQGKAGQAGIPDAVCWAAIRKHEQDMAAGRARWQ